MFLTKVEPLFCNWIKHHIPHWQDCIVVSPDEGGAKRSVRMANDLGLEFAMIHNRCSDGQDILAHNDIKI